MLPLIELLNNKLNHTYYLVFIAILSLILAYFKEIYVSVCIDINKILLNLPKNKLVKFLINQIGTKEEIQEKKTRQLGF